MRFASTLVVHPSLIMPRCLSRPAGRSNLSMRTWTDMYCCPWCLDVKGEKSSMTSSCCHSWGCVVTMSMPATCSPCTCRTTSTHHEPTARYAAVWLENPVSFVQDSDHGLFKIDCSVLPWRFRHVPLREALQVQGATIPGLPWCLKS